MIVHVICCTCWPRSWIDVCYTLQRAVRYLSNFPSLLSSWRLKKCNSPMQPWTVGNIEKWNVHNMPIRLLLCKNYCGLYVLADKFLFKQDLETALSCRAVKMDTFEQLEKLFTHWMTQETTKEWAVSEWVRILRGPAINQAIRASDVLQTISIREKQPGKPSWDFCTVLKEEIHRPTRAMNLTKQSPIHKMR